MTRVNVPGGEPLFELVSHARRGPGRRDRLSPGDVALIARTVRGSPEVMVKVGTGGAVTMAAVRKHIDYVGRHGTLPLETEQGEHVQGEHGAQSLLEQWDLDLEEHRRSASLIASPGRAPSKLVHKLTLSMPGGTPPAGVLHAARGFLREEFGGSHRYAFALHTDRAHPHVHVVLKAVNESGVRLRIDKLALRRFRQRFAEHLRAQGLDANATARAVRGQSRQTQRDSIFRAARRGESTHMKRRVQAVARELSSGGLREEPGKLRVLRTRRTVEAGWLALARVLREEGRLTLAAQVDRFVQRMPPPRTEKEQLAHELLHRAQAIRSRELPRAR